MNYADLPSLSSIAAGTRLSSAVVALFHEIDMPSQNSHPGASDLVAFFDYCKTQATARVRIPVTGVTITNSTTATVGETKAYAATIAPAGAQNKAVVWSTSDPAKAVVDQYGSVTFLAAGSVTVTATSVDDPSKAGSRTVTVS